MKATVQHINYSLKTQIRQTGNDMFSGDGAAIITYDYYDTVDLVVIVKNAKGKVLSTNTQNDIIGDLRYKGKTFAPKSVLEATDASETFLNGLPVIGKDVLQGNTKDYFKDGIDFYLDDDGSILNIRGLEKMSSSPNPQRVEVSELLAIGGNQGGGNPSTRLMDAIDNIGNTAEHLHTTVDNIPKVKVEIEDIYYRIYTNTNSGKKSIEEQAKTTKDTFINSGDESRTKQAQARKNNNRRNEAKSKIKS